jgi:hypothetical protein
VRDAQHSTLDDVAISQLPDCNKMPGGPFFGYASTPRAAVSFSHHSRSVSNRYNIQVPHQRGAPAAMV